MYRKLMFVAIALFMLVIFAACTNAAPQSAPEAEVPAVEATATQTPAEEPDEESATDESAGDDVATYTVDTEASTVEWYGSKPVGASESGIIQIAEGELSFSGSELVDGTMVIDMTTIEPTSQTGNMLDMLTGHLKSDEFFGVETYPTATLAIKSAEATDVPNQYNVVADLTIKETTNEIEFLTDVVVNEDMLEATADIVVDRSIYDVRYGSGSFFSDLGDDLISDEMEIAVTLVAGS